MPAPKQKRGSSKQDYGTWPPFLRAVESVFGPITLDLAATSANKVVPRYFSPTPDLESSGVDSLKQDWAATLGLGLGFLNPGFGHIPPWVKKAVVEGKRGARTLVLVPASVSSEWFYLYVWRHCVAHFLFPKFPFLGMEEVGVFPKDLMLLEYGTSRRGIAHFNWERSIPEELRLPGWEKREKKLTKNAT